MNTQAASTQKKSTVDATRSQQDLIRLLLAQLCDQEIGNSFLECEDPMRPSEEVILDVDVDGARYLVLRLPQANRVRSVLSPREHEIVRMVSQGHPNKVIADVLGISSWTVCTHMRRIFAKLGVTSRAAMVARLLETGIMSDQLFATSVR